MAGATYLHNPSRRLDFPLFVSGGVVTFSPPSPSLPLWTMVTYISPLFEVSPGRLWSPYYNSREATKLKFGSERTNFGPKPRKTGRNSIVLIFDELENPLVTESRQMSSGEFKIARTATAATSCKRRLSRWFPAGALARIPRRPRVFR